MVFLCSQNSCHMLFHDTIRSSRFESENPTRGLQGLYTGENLYSNALLQRCTLTNLSSSSARGHCKVMCVCVCRIWNRWKQKRDQSLTWKPTSDKHLRQWDHSTLPFDPYVTGVADVTAYRRCRNVRTRRRRSVVHVTISCPLQRLAIWKGIGGNLTSSERMARWCQ